MLTDQDIKRLTEHMTGHLLEVFKGVFATKVELLELGNSLNRKMDDLAAVVDSLGTSVGKLSAAVDDLSITVERTAVDVSTMKDEMMISNYRIKNLENWADSAAPAIGLKFEH